MKRGAIAFCLLLMLPPFVSGTTRTWNGTSGNWSDAAKWGGTVPQAGEDAVINAGTVVLGSATPGLLSLTMGGGTLVFTNWSTILNATTVTLNGTSKMSLPPTFLATIMSNRVNIACSNLTIGSSAMIDVNGLGYRGGTNQNDEGDGPGGGQLTTTYYGGGGGHGGTGGNGVSGLGGVTNDVLNAPMAPGSGGGGNGAGHGGGMVRIHASGTVTVNGTIRADGSLGNPHGGGGSGGGLFISCREFKGAATGSLKANGGDASWFSAGQYGGGAGGGRIAVAIGMTDTQIQALIDDDPVTGLFAYYDHGSYAGVVSVTNGTDRAAGVDKGHSGYPGTFRFLCTLTSTNIWLKVNGNPSEADAPSPYGYGYSPNIRSGTWVTNTVTSPFVPASGSGYALLQWAVTNQAGATIASGAGNTAVFQASTNLILTYYWTNIYQCTVTPANGAQGSVNAGVVAGWYTNGTVVTNIAASPAGGYSFHRWTGTGVPAGMETSNPLTVTMNQPRFLIANFGSNAGEVRTWAGTGNWLQTNRWTPSGMPGPKDAARIPSGTVTISQPVWAGSVGVTNGATVIFTNWSAALSAGDVVVKGKLTLPPAFEETAMSNRVRVTCTSFTLGSAGKIDAKGMGFIGGRSFVEPGHGPGKGILTGQYYGGGGGHGGRGGDGKAGVGGVTNDAVNAPTIPGSGGGGNGGGKGGSAAWITASGKVTIDGIIDTDGTLGSPHGGGGSGGAIFISCLEFEGGAGAQLRANGGNSCYYSPTQYGGSGGGGRIAVAIGVGPSDLAKFLEGEETTFKVQTTHSAYLGTATVTNGTNATTPNGDPGTLRFIIAPGAGAVFMFL